MKTARAAAVLTLLAGLISAEVQNLDLLRLLMERPLLGGHNRWDRRLGIEDRMDQLLHRKYEDRPRYNGDVSGASKRSAVATALNAGRPRRQPAPALGKAVTVTPFAGVGILNDMENFFESLRGNLHLAVSPEDRVTYYDTPSVELAPSPVHRQVLEPGMAAPSSNPNSFAAGGGGGSGMRKLHALRPLRPTGNIRSYNRRSLVDDHIYPGANRHDPGLLWAGLGR